MYMYVCRERERDITIIVISSINIIINKNAIVVDWYCCC